MEESGRTKRKLRITVSAALLVASLVAGSYAVAGTAEFVQRTELPDGVELQPPLPDTSTYPAQLVLDDNSAESVVGVFGATSSQFLWFNRFTAGNVEISEIWVFFPAGQGVAAGDDIELVIYQDSDGDPTNGATHLFSLDTTVLVANGLDFSIYPIPPTEVEGDALVGVIPRFIESGVTPPVSPAALDTGASQGRSYLAFWLGDPPAVPTLPTDDDTVLLDDLVAGGGNWTIRAFGLPVAGIPVTEIPVATPAGLAILSLLLATAAFLILRQRRPSPGSDETTWRRR
jgi:hypothetical protein